MRKWLAGWLGQCSAWLAGAADRVFPPYSKRYATGGEVQPSRRDDDSVPVILLEGADGSHWEIRGQR